MAATQAQIIERAKDIAQDPSTSSLLLDSDGYTRAVALALAEFQLDSPNQRIVHYTVASAGFRFVLSGTGAILSGSDAWTRGKSRMTSVWLPYLTTSQDRVPLDAQAWRVIHEPTLVVLELLADTAQVDQVLRLEFDGPHSIDANTAGSTTIAAGDIDAFCTLVAAYVLEMYAARAVQNTGGSGIAGDIVDRRTPSDQAAARAKMLRDRYGKLIGKASGDEPARPLSSAGDIDVTSSHVHGFLFKPRSRR